MKTKFEVSVEITPEMVEKIAGKLVERGDCEFVVRCKDCKWHEEEQPGMVYCPNTVGGWVKDDWFCKGGER